jgi:hypothetical protein
MPPDRVNENDPFPLGAVNPAVPASTGCTDNRPSTPRRHALDDDPPEVRARVIEILRETPTWRKVELASEMWQTCRTFALAGLRRRHPALDEAALQRRLPALFLPRELVIKVYGWDPEELGY